jgi:hypothetical protein
MNNLVGSMVVTPACWIRPIGPVRYRMFRLLVVEGIALLSIPWVIQCYQHLQVFVAHMNLRFKGFR